MNCRSTSTAVGVNDGRFVGVLDDIGRSVNSTFGAMLGLTVDNPTITLYI